MHGQELVVWESKLKSVSNGPARSGHHTKLHHIDHSIILSIGVNIHDVVAFWARNG